MRRSKRADSKTLEKNWYFLCRITTLKANNTCWLKHIYRLDKK
jgi:hypothetical protein